MASYDTNLAAEFHVLSMLHRLGADASLTLGNKKAVDIVVARDFDVVTIDVKGVAGPHDWPCDNVRLPAKVNYFIVLVSFEGHIGDPKQIPSTWIIPATEIEVFIRSYQIRKVIVRSQVRAKGSKYLHAWGQIITKVGSEP